MRHTLLLCNEKSNLCRTSDSNKLVPNYIFQLHSRPLNNFFTLKLALTLSLLRFWQTHPRQQSLTLVGTSSPSPANVPHDLSLFSNSLIFRHSQKLQHPWVSLPYLKFSFLSPPVMSSSGLDVSQDHHSPNLNIPFKDLFFDNQYNQ